MTPNRTNPVDWDRVADDFCHAWTSDIGRPDFDRLAAFYAPDDDVVIFDALPPLEGFRGFAAVRSEIYDGLDRICVERTGDVTARPLADGAVVVTSYPFRLAYAFADGRRVTIDARITEVWERRPDGYVIVHEHPSTVVDAGDQADSRTV